MKCIHCRGEMRRASAPLHVDRKGCHIVLDAVRAWVCEQCGEPFFEEKEVEAIHDLVKSVEAKTKTLATTA